MANDSVASTLATAAASSLTRVGDLNYAQAATGLVDATGAVSAFLNASGQLVNAAGTNTLAGTPQALAAAGAVNLTTLCTTIASAGAIALTLADGAAGQLKVIGMITDGGDATLTPANLRAGTTITFNDVGDAVLLAFLGGEWNIVANTGATVA